MLGVYTEIQTVEGDMATVNPEALDALNALLEDQRASVEIEVALTMGATDLRERDTFTTMGSEDVLACITLREHLERAGVPVTLRINGIVLAVLDMETYDDRLRAFVELHMGICERVSELLPQTTDQELRSLLQDMYNRHRQSAEWCAQRADAFDYSRTLDFRTPHRTHVDEEQPVDDPQWEPSPQPEASREDDAAETSRPTASHAGWYSDDAADDLPGDDPRQENDPPGRPRGYLRANGAHIDNR